jgi:hypothetical protein
MSHKVSILKLSTARNMAFQLIKQLPMTKISNSITHNDNLIKKALKNLYDVDLNEQEEIEAATINHAATDEKGILLFTLSKDNQGMEQKVYKYTKEEELAKNKDIRAITQKYQDIRASILYDENGVEKEISISPLTTSEYPKGMNLEIVEAFKGVYLSFDCKERVELDLIK